MSTPETSTAEEVRYRIREVRLATGVRIPLLCRNDLPVYETTFWTIGDLLGNSSSTICTKLRAVAHWLHANEGLDWSARVKTGKFLSPGETSEAQKMMGLAVHLHNSNKAVKKFRVASHIQAARVACLRQYLCWLAGRQIYSIQGEAQSFVNQRYEEWLLAWNTSESKEITSEQPSPSSVGLTQEQRELFLTVIKPGHPSNPFESGMQVRNYTIFMLLYEHGMRMGDVLLLRTDDVHFDTKSFWVAERKNDPYETRKRAPRAKRQGRTARERMFSQASLSTLQHWLEEDRMDESRFPGASRRPHVFVSERGNALSDRRFSFLFEILRTKFPEHRDGHRLLKVGFKSNFSPNDLRHDWCVRFILAHHKDWTAHDDWTMRYEMGWTQKSKMPSYYARIALRELGGKAIEKISAERTYEAMKRIEEMPF